jgi:hypothetical protein
MTMLIDDRAGAPPPGERRPIEPNWRIWSWVIVAAVVAYAAAHAHGVVGYLLVCAVVYAVCRAIAACFEYMGGLTEWRQ